MTNGTLTDDEARTVQRADDALAALQDVVQRSARLARRLLEEPIINPGPKADHP